MLTEEMFVDIIVLHRQGMSLRKIARKLGCSRNTVKKYIEQRSAPRFSKRLVMPTKLEPFKPYLQQRIKMAKPDWIPAVVLLREIKQQGYSGGVTQLREYLFPFKEKVIEPVVRFETPPAKQMQIDFTTIRHGKLKLKAFVATLGYSRASFVKFYTHERSDAWQDGLVSAFEYFGGVVQSVLCDNAKAIIIARDAYGDAEHQWHSGMLQLAKDYGFSLKVCRPYRAKTKGKVERFNHYLKNSFIVPLRAELKQQNLALDVTMANGKIGAWLHDVAHQRIHGTTGEKPQILLDKERQLLLPLPHIVSNKETVNPVVFPIVPPIILQHPMHVYEQLLGGHADA
jgi:transposase